MSIIKVKNIKYQYSPYDLEDDLEKDIQLIKQSDFNAYITNFCKLNLNS